MTRRFQLATMTALALGATLALPTAAQADGKTKTAVNADVNGNPGRDPGTRSLNRDASSAARQQNDANAASAATFQRSNAEVTAATAAAAQARRDYDAAMERYHSAQSSYADAHARWEADVAACTHGDHSRCDTGAAPK